jgi:hypothetical protein
MEWIGERADVAEWRNAEIDALPSNMVAEAPHPQPVRDLKPSLTRGL